ncbi:MAG TPA: hypothetical protein PKL13_05115, partial [bacterium]|nr:hypothetical protein [bacterium]
KNKFIKFNKYMSIKEIMTKYQKLLKDSYIDEKTGQAVLEVSVFSDFLKSSLYSLVNEIKEKTLDKMEELSNYARENKEDYEAIGEANFAIAQVKEIYNFLLELEKTINNI